ncbi:MAG: hypothetical protein QM802_15835 [Agriterribacter sp.]
MKMKMMLPALTKAKNSYWLSIKCWLFQPPGLATLAAYCEGDDEHMEIRNTGDEFRLVTIHVYITNACMFLNRMTITGTNKNNKASVK